jgi:hypothetical protein
MLRFRDRRPHAGQKYVVAMVNHAMSTPVGTNMTKNITAPNESPDARAKGAPACEDEHDKRDHGAAEPYGFRCSDGLRADEPPRANRKREPQDEITRGCAQPGCMMSNENKISYR